MKYFIQGFLMGAKETPRAYFAPAVALWRVLLTTTDTLCHGAHDIRKK